MSRHDYPLTDETRKVLSGNCPKVAEGMHVTATYVYGILDGTNPDAFAYYQALYEAAISRGVDVTSWDAKLAEIKARYRGNGRALSKAVQSKVREEGDTNALLVEIVADGDCDDLERVRLFRATAAERETLNHLECAAIHGPDNIRDFAARAVHVRRNQRG